MTDLRPSGGKRRQVLRVAARLGLHALADRVGRSPRVRVRRWWAARAGVPTLVFANAYAGLGSVPEVAPFFGQVERLAGDRLRVMFVNGWTRPGDRDEERTVLRDLANGLADIAWVGARVVGAVLGIDSLEPLHAPLLFPDDLAVRQVLSLPSVSALLEPLREVGLEGLVLLPGGLRRPFGITSPLIGPEDWRGKVIRTHTSLLGEASLRSLGATPVLRSAAELRANPPPGIDGMDLHPGALAARRYSGWFTWNVPLWPRLVLLVANRSRLERLSAAGRTALREAARRGLVEAVVGLPRERRADTPGSIRLVEASEEDLDLLRGQFRSVYDQIHSTSQGGRTLSEIERLVAALRRPAAAH